MASSIDVSLRLRNAKRFEQDAKKSGKAVGDIGKGAKKGAKDLDKLERSTRKAHKGFSGLGKGAKLALGAIGGAAAFSAAKSAISATQDLTKTTIGLQRATKMDNTEAVRWAAQAKVRGIDAKAMNMAMGSLSKNTQLATEGGKSQQKAFDRLGISQKDIAATGGDISKLLPQMADRFKAMGPSQARTTSMMALMGKGWQTITPLMADGAKAMDEQLKMADKYGVTLGGKPIKTQKDLLAVQREMKMAQLGWQVQFSTQVAPRLIKAFKWILGVSQSLKGVFAWADRHPGIVKAIASMALLSAAMKRVPGGSWLSRHMLSGLGGLTRKLLAKFLPGFAAVKTEAATTGTIAGRRMGNNTSTAGGAAIGKSAKGGKMSSAFALAGKVLGGVFVASFIAQMTGLENADPLLFLHPPAAGDPRPGHGDVPAPRGSSRSRATKWVHKHHPGAIIRAGETIEQTAKRLGWKGRQHGGPIRAGMSALVGERGPEVLHARPLGGFVQPLGTPKLNVPQLAMAGGGGEDHFTSHTVLNIDGRTAAEASERYTRQKRASR